MNFLVALGSVLRTARLEANLSQERLADKAGVYRNTVGLVERGDMSVSVQTLDHICEALSCRPWQVLLEAEFLLDGAQAASKAALQRHVSMTAVAAKAAATKRERAKAGEGRLKSASSSITPKQ